MIEALIGRLGLPVLVNVISGALSSIDNPVAQGAARALEQVDAAIQGGDVTAEQVAEANRHAERMAEIRMQENAADTSEGNKTLRAEIASKDAYVRRMRPTFGYMMAVTWAAQMLGLSYVIVFETEKAGVVLNAMSSLSAIWAMGLSVLGIYVYKRSEEKKGAPQGPETIMWRKN